MEVLYWIGIVLLAMLIGTVTIHLWVYAAVRAYYTAMLDAYVKGALRALGRNKGGADRTNEYSNTSASSEQATPQSTERTRMHSTRGRNGTTH